MPDLGRPGPSRSAGSCARCPASAIGVRPGPRPSRNRATFLRKVGFQVCLLRHQSIRLLPDLRLPRSRSSCEPGGNVRPPRRPDRPSPRLCFRRYSSFRIACRRSLQLAVQGGQLGARAARSSVACRRSDFGQRRRETARPARPRPAASSVGRPQRRPGTRRSCRSRPAPGRTPRRIRSLRGSSAWAYQWKSMPLRVEFAVAGLELDASTPGVGIDVARASTGRGPSVPSCSSTWAIAAGQNTPKPLTSTTAISSTVSISTAASAAPVAQTNGSPCRQNRLPRRIAAYSRPNRFRRPGAPAPPLCSA